MVLQAYPDRSPHEPEAGVALIHHCVPVTEAIAADVTIHDGVRGATVAGWKMNKTNKYMLESVSSVKAHLWTNNRVLLFSTGRYMQQPGTHQNGRERETDYASCVTELLCCREEINTMSTDYVSIKNYRSNAFIICLYCQVTNSLEYKQYLKVFHLYKYKYNIYIYILYVLLFSLIFFNSCGNISNISNRKLLKGIP